MKFLKNISHDQLGDEELLQQYHNGRDLQLLGSLYSRYMDLVYGVCLKYLSEPELAQDAVMNIFEELVTKLHKYDVANFKSWLYTLAKNHCLMQLRSAKHKQTVSILPDIMYSAEELHLNGIMNSEASFNALQLCMEGLSDDQKQGIRLFYLEEKSYKEISGITGNDAGKVRSLIQNGRRNLKICMEKQVKPED